MRPADDNPYVAPEVGASGPRPTRWRIALVTLLVIFGVLGVMSAPISLLVAYARPLEMGGGITVVRIVGVLARVLGATSWVIAGVLCWKSRWRSFAAMMALGLGGPFVAHQLLRDLE